MNILMFTNTYLPHVGGVARSVSTFVASLREKGHRVVVVAPEYEDRPEEEADVVRVPSLRNFRGSDFSVGVAVPGYLTAALGDFRPDLVHSHHPFLLGDTALRVSRAHDVPLVFTNHTLYDHYVHYVSQDSDAVKKFVIQLWTGYASLSDVVVAPSRSVALLLRRRGVRRPIRVVPTGVDVGLWKRGNGERFRKKAGVPRDAFVVGHWGRLAREKNLPLLARVVGRFLALRPDAHFVLAGSGPDGRMLARYFKRIGVADRVHAAGVLQGRALADAARSMNAFVFASRSETQGMVLAEAMAAGVPVVALDASGARDIVRDRVNGRLIREEDPARFVEVLTDMYDGAGDQKLWSTSAEKTAGAFSFGASLRKMIRVYEYARTLRPLRSEVEDGPWSAAMRMLKTQADLFSNLADAARAALS